MPLSKSPQFAAAVVFAALGDPVRLALVSQLCDQGPMPTVQLKQATHLSRQAVTKHLQTLEQAGIVHSDRNGRDRMWRMEPRRIQDVRHYLERISSEWDATLERLRRFVEDDPC